MICPLSDGDAPIKNVLFCLYWENSEWNSVRMKTKHMITLNNKLNINQIYMFVLCIPRWLAMRLGGVPGGVGGGGSGGGGGGGGPGIDPLAMAAADDYAELCDLGPSRWSSRGYHPPHSSLHHHQHHHHQSASAASTGHHHAVITSSSSATHHRSNSFEADDGSSPYGGSTSGGVGGSGVAGSRAIGNRCVLWVKTSWIKSHLRLCIRIGQLLGWFMSEFKLDHVCMSMMTK